MYICMYVRRYITIQLIMVYVNGWCQFPAIPEDDGGRHKSSAVNLLLQTHRTLRNSKHQSDIKVYDEYDDHIAIQSIQVHPVYTYIEYTIYIYCVVASNPPLIGTCCTSCLLQGPNLRLLFHGFSLRNESERPRKKRSDGHPYRSSNIDSPCKYV